MTLTYGKSSPWDLLDKAQRDLARLEHAEQSNDGQASSDAILDLAVALISIKDWLKAHPNAGYSRSAVEKYAKASTAIQSMRDVANAGKHRHITDYTPQVSNVEASASAPVSPRLPSHTPTISKTSRLKVVFTSQRRDRAADLARQAIADWTAFMQQHGVAR